ncbi:hypothetical protein L9F63_005829, partial [Diploptera punctata]
MNVVDVARLQSKSKELRRDLIFDHICSELLQADLINQEDYQIIRVQSTESKKIDILIEILPTKGPETLDKFIGILERNYQWLAESLRNSDPQNISDNENENKCQNLEK